MQSKSLCPSIDVINREEPGFCQIPVISQHFARNAKKCQVLCRLPSFMSNKMLIAEDFTWHLLKQENNTHTQQTTHTMNDDNNNKLDK